MAWFNYAIARRAATLLFLATAAALKVPHAPTAQPRRNAAAPLLKRVASAAVAFSALSAPLVALPEAALAAKPSDAATSAGSRVNKDPESLLRNGLPIGGAIGSATKKAEARKVQQAVEAIKDDLRQWENATFKVENGTVKVGRWTPPQQPAGQAPGGSPSH